MITTRWGTRVEVLAQYGEHRVLHLPEPVTLLFVRFTDPEKPDCTWDGYRFQEFLRATDGFAEILEAVRKVPLCELSGDELTMALEEAQ